MSSEEQQLEAEESTQEVSQELPSGPMTIDEALLLYKNLQINVFTEIDRMLSPFLYDKKGKRTKSKTEYKKMQDLVWMAQILKAAIQDIEPNPAQFNTDKGKHLYGSILAIFKAKEVIKADLKSKLLSEDAPENISPELKEKLLKEL